MPKPTTTKIVANVTAMPIFSAFEGEENLYFTFCFFSFFGFSAFTFSAFSGLTFSDFGSFSFFYFFGFFSEFISAGAASVKEISASKVSLSFSFSFFIAFSEKIIPSLIIVVNIKIQQLLQYAMRRFAFFKIQALCHSCQNDVCLIE